MRYCYLFIIFCVVFNVVLSAPQHIPSVFDRNGLQREQENVLIREPFEPKSPFPLPGPHQNDQTGPNGIVVPTTNLLKTYNIRNEKEFSRDINTHFETLNKDALVGILIENQIPFYVKTIVDPHKSIETKIHVMRIPKKHESTTPLPNVDLNVVDINGVHLSELPDPDDVKTELLSLTSGNVNVKKPENQDSILATTDERVTQTNTPATNTDQVSNVTPEEQLQNDDPNTNTKQPDVVYEHQVIYKPQKSEDSKSIWGHIGDAFEKAKEKTEDFAEKAKEKTGDFVEKAKEKTSDLVEKAKAKAKEVFDSDEKISKEKEAANPADDI